MKSVIEIQKERLEHLKKLKAKKADTEAMQESVNRLEEIEQRVKQTNTLINGSKSEANEWKIGEDVWGQIISILSSHSVRY